MSNIATIQTKIPNGVIENVLVQGDLAQLTPEQRTTYYSKVCESLGLNPLTKPFEYITLNGRLQLYALKAATDQLRKINSVSLSIVSREVSDGILTVHVRASLPDGRIDEDLGAVAFPDTLKGEARVNAELKAITKAKRRATLSICGLGWLDETEVRDISTNGTRPPPHDPMTGEVTTIDSEQVQNLRDMITAAKASEAKFLKWAKVERVEDIAADLYDSCIDAIQNVSKARAVS
jgi:hypothetical protein